MDMPGQAKDDGAILRRFGAVDRNPDMVPGFNVRDVWQAVRELQVQYLSFVFDLLWNAASFQEMPVHVARH